MSSDILVVLRYDDYHASLGAESAEKDSIEERLLEVAADTGAPITMAVVPLFEERAPLADDPAKLAALREALDRGVAEAALHGLTHTALTPPGVRQSEFAGQPFEAQLERLRQGRALLEEWLGAPPASFVPPWNTYDRSTERALAELGFRVVSADLSAPLVGSPLVSLPHTCGLRRLPRVVARARRAGGLVVAVSMFHHFSFHESRSPLARHYAQTSLAGLREIIAKCREMGARFVRLQEAVEVAGDGLLDGRLDEAAERWKLALRWRRMPLAGKLLTRALLPGALMPPGTYAAGNKLLLWLPPREPRAPSPDNKT